MNKINNTNPITLLHLLINDYTPNCDDVYMNSIREKQNDKLYKKLKKQLIINRTHSSIIKGMINDFFKQYGISPNVIFAPDKREDVKMFGIDVMYSPEFNVGLMLKTNIKE